MPDSTLILDTTNEPLIVSGASCLKVGTTPSIIASITNQAAFSSGTVQIDFNTNLNSGTIYVLLTTTPAGKTKADITRGVPIIASGTTRYVEEGLIGGETLTILWWIEDFQGNSSPADPGFNTHGTTVTIPGSLVAPTSLSPTSITIYEDQAINQTIASFTSNGTNCSFSEILDSSNVFTVGSAGALSLSASVAAINSPYSVTVRASNGAGNFDQVVTVNVNEIQSTIDADVVVSSEAAIQSQLNSWSTNWNGTTPAGKTNSDERVLALDTPITSLNLNGYTFPQRVTVRSVGPYTVGASFPYKPSTGADITNDVAINNCTNLRCYLLSFRKASGNGNTNSGFERCSLQGPQTNISSVPSSVGSSHQNSDAFYYKSCRIASFFDYGVSIDGGMTNLSFEENVFEFIGDDNLKGRNPNSNPIANSGAIVRRNWWSTYNTTSAGSHPDIFQAHTGSWPNLLFWGNVGILKYTNTLLQGVWLSDSSVTDNLLCEQNIHCINGLPGLNCQGGTNQTARYNTILRSELGASGSIQTRWTPLINGGFDTLSNNFVTASWSGQSSGEGVNGIKLVIGNANNAVPNWSVYAPYFTGRPGNNSDIGAVEPVNGSRAHWDHATPCGAYLRSKELFLDGVGIPGNIGWPVAESWTRQYNNLGSITTSYTGTYDSNGDNV